MDSNPHTLGGLPVEETTICLQCGNRGYENAFVYCIRCLNFAVHRYCLDVLPDSFDEFVSWLCDDCNLKERKQYGILDHDTIPSQTRHHEVSNNIEGFSGNGNKKIDLVVAETNNHVREDVSEQTYIACAKSDLVECGELASQHTPAPIEFPAGCLTQKLTRFKIKIKFKKREDNIRESTTEKDQDRLGTVFYDDCLKVDINECTRLASDSSLPSKVKEVFQQKDQTSLSKHFDSVTDLGIAGVPADHSVISSNGPSRCSKKDGNAILSPEDVNKRSQLQEEKVEENLIEQKKRKIKITFKRRERNFSESTTEKDQGRLSTACNDECSKVDIIECTRSANDSTLPSKVKENEFFEQKDQLCISKPFDVITYLDIAFVPADHPGISSNGPSVGLKNDGNGILLPADVSNRSQLDEEKIEGNLIEPIELSAGCLKQKKERNNMGSTIEKDQHRLATASYDERVEVDINESPISASDSTLPSKVKENECSEKKDLTCVSKPFDSTTDLGIAVVPAGHPVISCNGSSMSFKNDENGILLPADVSKRSQFEEKMIEGNLIEPIELSAGCLKRKKKKKKKRNIMESITEKDEHGLATASYDERVKADIKECTGSASDSTLPSKVKENKCSELKDETFVSKPFDSTTDLCIAVLPSDYPAIDGSSMSLKNDGNGILLPEDDSKGSQLEEEKIEGNLIEPIELSTVCLKRKKKKKRKKNIMESTSEKDQHGLATASYVERVKEDIKECTRSAHDSTLPSKVKENEFCEQKDQMCISKPVDSTTDLGIAVVPAGHPVIPNNGSSMSLKNDGNDILLPADFSKRSQFEEEKIEGNLIEPIELSAGCLKRKKKKKRKRTIMESTTEKDQHGLATTSYDEHVIADITECTRSASDSTLRSKVKESKCSELKDRMCVSKPIDSTKRSQLEEEKIVGNLIEPIDLSAGCLKQKKKKRKRTILESTAEKDQLRLATTSYDEHVIVDINECTRSASDSTLPSKVKENKCSEQKEHMCVSKLLDSTKRSHQLEEEKIVGNLIEPIDVSAGCLKQKKKKKRNRTIMESTAQKDQHGLATTSYDERVKVDFTECARSASDSTLPSKVKENKCCEQKDHMCVSKPFDSTKRSQLEEEKIEGSLIEPIDLSAGCLKQKKKKKRKRTIMESTAEKDQHGLATTSYDERVKVDFTECTRSASDSTLPSMVKENKCAEQKDRMCVSKPCDSAKPSQLEEKRIEGNLIEPTDLSAGFLKLKKKKKRKRNIMESTTEKDQHRPATKLYDEHVIVDINDCTRSASDSTLPSKVKENKCSEQKNHMCVSKPFDSTKRSQLEEEKIVGNLIEPIDLSAGCLKQKKKKKRERNVMESTNEKDQHRLATTLYDERVKVDISECTRSASDSTLPSTVTENSGVPADHPVTSSNFVQPVAVPVWRGSFSIWNENYDNIDLLVAHISNKACHKVYEATSQLQPVLRLEMRPKSDLWPTSFQTAKPNGDNIALYFLPSKTSEQVFEQLVGEMIHKELAFRAFVQNAELLIFTSTELPLLYWTFRSKYYLWGVFRGKQQPPSSNALSSDGEFAEIPLMGKRCDDRSPVGPLNNSAPSV